jgi:hypothetical protein
MLRLQHNIYNHHINNVFEILNTTYNEHNIYINDPIFMLCLQIQVECWHRFNINDTLTKKLNKYPQHVNW